MYIPNGLLSSSLVINSDDMPARSNALHVWVDHQTAPTVLEALLEVIPVAMASLVRVLVQDATAPILLQVFAPRKALRTVHAVC